MEQIVEYSAIKKITDITKVYAEIPMSVEQDEDGKVQFTIANYNEFVNRIRAILEEEYSGEIIITEYNVATYEKEASEINKLKKQIKDSANNFVNSFTTNLLGITKGKNKNAGQVQVMENLLNCYYDKIHTKTKEFRESNKADLKQENVIEAQFTEHDENIAKIVCKVPLNELESFSKYCKEHNIKIEK